MRSKQSDRRLPLLAAALGVLTLALRTGLLLIGTDEKGLLVPWHPLAILTWAATAGTVVYFVLTLRRKPGSQLYAENFSASTPAALGCFALAAGIALTVLPAWSGASKIELARNLFGILAVPSFVWAGILRRRGQPPFFLGNVCVCIYFTLYAVSHYRPWCSQPQLQWVFFSAAALLLLCLFAYAQAAFAADMGSGRMQPLTGLLAGFCAIAAIPGGDDPLLLLCSALWALSNLCRIQPTAEETRHEAA